MTESERIDDSGNPISLTHAFALDPTGPTGGG